MKKVTVTIGIPAYNEEANIGFLLQDLLAQVGDLYSVDKIIVVSDASTDRTDELVKNTGAKVIKHLRNNKRRGVGYCENIIIENSSTDYMVIVNADTRISDKKFLEKIFEFMIKNNIDLGSPKVVEVESNGFFEKTLKTSMEIKTRIFEAYRDGNNVYTCHGQVRIFSKKMYKNLSFKSGIGDDAYSYFYCLGKKLKYSYIKNVKAYYKLPENFKDHKKQSLRFFHSQKLLQKYFGKEFVKKEYELPVGLTVKTFISYLFENFGGVVLYILVYFYLKSVSFFAPKINETWEISQSSKIHLLI